MVRVAGLYAGLAAASFLLSLLWQASGIRAERPDVVGLQFFSHVLGELDGRACPSYPVCSLYATQAVRKHGLWLGSWLMLDRLIHEGDEIYRGRWLTIDGEQRLYDPLQRNDFWLRKTDWNNGVHIDD